MRCYVTVSEYSAVSVLDGAAYVVGKSSCAIVVIVPVILLCSVQPVLIRQLYRVNSALLTAP